MLKKHSFRKQLILIFFISLYSVLTFAQDKANTLNQPAKKNLLFISGGITLPHGNYTELMEYATTGYDFSFNYMYSSNRNFGILSQVKLISNPRDLGKMKKNGAYTVYSPTTNINSGNYSRLSLSGGLAVIAKLTSTFNIDFKAYIGAVYAGYPSLKITDSTQPLSSFNLKSKHKLFPGYGFNCTARQDINQNYFIGISGDYSFSKTTFKNIESEITTTNGDSYSNKYDLPLEMNALSILLSFGIKL